MKLFKLHTGTTRPRLAAMPTIGLLLLAVVVSLSFSG
jgi:hypothetical protein